MTSKAILTIGKYVAKKAGKKSTDKAIQKIIKPYERFKREVFSIKPLNVGERETIECLKNPRNSLKYCSSIGDNVRKKYHKTGKYK